MTMNSIYEPREDSFLLVKHVKTEAFGRVLDMGTGTGIQAEEAAKNINVIEVTAADINPEAINYCKKKIKNKKTRFIISDLFSNLKNEIFDTIIFNPPYLPEHQKVKDIALDGGKKGHELIERFFNEVSSHLSEKGVILILFSSITGKDKVNEIIIKNRFHYTELNSLNLDFEKLYMYLVKKG